MLEELYQEIILDHYRRPRNKGQATPSDISAHDSNPLCGDEIDVTARLANHKIADLKFDGKGCAICTASASIMTQKLIGKTLPEATQFIDSFLKMMRGNVPFGGKELGDLKALEGIMKYPVRVKCATLAWNTALQGFQEHAAKKS
jgi:nitrogen fixation NifU-like protein